MSRPAMELGLGIGWLPGEFELAGGADGRGGVAGYVPGLPALWSPGPDGLGLLDGDCYAVPPGRQQPTPVQQPGPPIILGGMSRPAMKPAGRIAAGWLTSSRADLTRL